MQDFSYHEKLLLKMELHPYKHNVVALGIQKIIKCFEL